MNDETQRKTPGGFTGKGFVKGDPRKARRMLKASISLVQQTLG
jgi:hypothetical protein